MISFQCMNVSDTRTLILWALLSNGSQLINGCIFFLSEAISPKKWRRGETTVASAEASYHSVPRGKKTGKKNGQNRQK